MHLCDTGIELADDAPDVAAALCHELRLPLDHLLERIDRAHRALERRASAGIDDATLKALRCLADAHATARHVLRVVDDVDARVRIDGRRERRLDVRTVVRAAAAMMPALDIAVDAADVAFVDGVDTQLVHVFATLLAELGEDEVAVIARVRAADGGVVVELRYEDPSRAPAGDARRMRPRDTAAVGRSVVRHIVATHRGRIERWPLAGAGVFARVTLPAAQS
jgi:signal transduction histidine kinase